MLNSHLSKIQIEKQISIQTLCIHIDHARHINMQSILADNLSQIKHNLTKFLLIHLSTIFWNQSSSS
jgi:hypothetical protein